MFHLGTDAVDLAKKAYTNKKTADWIQHTEVQFLERIANRLNENYVPASEEAKISLSSRILNKTLCFSYL